MQNHSQDQPPSPKSMEARASNRARFEVELEFVQSLANPYYLHSLAQQGVLEEPAFVEYLKYLEYWREREYARFIQYPHALHHLELLQHARFRSEIKRDEWREYLNQKQFDHWRTWRSGMPPQTAGYSADPASARSIPGSAIPNSASGAETMQFAPTPTPGQ